MQMVALPGTTWERLIIWLVIGMLVYFGYGRRNAERTRAERLVHRSVPAELSVVNS
jgi:heme/copper-type cytochrome/quinol oxidase subunit 2